jgi:hypothetical protein
MLSTVPSVRTQDQGQVQTDNNHTNNNSCNSSEMINKVEVLNDNLSSTTEKMVKSFHKFMFSDKKGNLYNDNKYVQTNNFGKIDNIEKTEFINNISSDDSGILVNVDKNEQKFNFCDKSKNPIGSFSINELVKYIGHTYDLQGQFLTHLGTQPYNEAVGIIKNMIGSVNYDKSTKSASINLLDFDKSPFMSDINLIVKLNSMLHDFEKEKLENELSKVDDKYKKKIRQIIKKFIYRLLNYTLQLISIISDTIKDDDSKHKLKDELIKYSVGTVFRISQYTQNELNTLLDRNNEIEKSLTLNIKLGELLDAKINNLSKQIEDMTSKYEIYQSGGSLHKKQLSSSTRYNQESDDQESDEKLVVTHSPYDNTYKYTPNSDSRSSEPNDSDESNDSDNESKKTYSDTSDSHFSAIYDYEFDV